MNRFQAALFHFTASMRGAVLAVQKGWQQAWARGEDTDTVGGAGSATLWHAEQQSAWVFRCLQLINGQITPLELEWYQRLGNDQAQVEEPDLVDFWSAPARTVNGRLTRAQFLEWSLNWINLKGQAFWVLDDSWLVNGVARSPIILARPDRMTAIMQQDQILGWRFLDGAGGSHALLPQQVIRPRIMDPRNEAEGLSPLDAAWIAASADHAAGLFARNVAQANGDQGVYVIAKNGNLSDEQQRQIVAQLRQKRELARRGEFRASFLTGDVTVEDPKVKTVDAAFIGGRNFSRDEIATAFGVPCSMLQRMDSYSIGAASDRYRFVEETCIPHGARLTDAMQEVERLRTGRGLVAELSWDRSSVLTEVRNERFKQAADLWKTGVPWDILNDRFDLGLDSFPGSNVAWLPMGLESKGELAIVKDQSSKMKAEGLGAFERLEAGLRALQSRDDKMTRGQDDKVTPEAEVTRSSGHPVTKSASLWEKHMRMRKPSEKLFMSKFNKVLMSARKETLAKVEASEGLKGIRQRGVVDLVFDFGRFVSELWVNMQAAHEATLETATGQLLMELQMSDPWSMPPPEVQAFLSRRRNLMTGVADEVFRDVTSALQEGLDAGESTAQLADRVRAEFTALSKERATVVAVTEVGAAYGAARDSGMQGLDIPFKQWVSAQDDRVRRTHRVMDGKVVAMGEAFAVPLEDGGTDLMQHPCDAEGSAENCINCRCIHVPVMSEEGI